MADDPWARGEAAAAEACRLVEHVRDDLPAAHRQLARLRREGTLPDVCVALAAMVPDDVPPTRLLAWTDPLAPAPTARQAYDADRYRRLRDARVDNGSSHGKLGGAAG